MKARHAAAISAGLGLAAPPIVLTIANYLGGAWLIIFWPTALALLGERIDPITKRVRPPTRFEELTDWAIVIGANVLLYVIVGMLIWSLVTITRRQLMNRNR
jgi:uncharacterized membrane protein